MHKKLNEALFGLSMLAIFMTSILCDFEKPDEFLWEHGINFAWEQVGTIALMALAAYFGSYMARAYPREAESARPVYGVRADGSEITACGEAVPAPREALRAVHNEVFWGIQSAHAHAIADMKASAGLAGGLLPTVLETLEPYAAYDADWAQHRYNPRSPNYKPGIDADSFKTKAEVDANPAAQDITPAALGMGDLLIGDGKDPPDPAMFEGMFDDEWDMIDGEQVIEKLRLDADALRAHGDGLDATDVAQNMENAATIIEQCIDERSDLVRPAPGDGPASEPQWKQLDEAIDRVRQIVIDNSKPIREDSSMVVKVSIDILRKARGYLEAPGTMNNGVNENNLLASMIGEAVERLTPLAYIPEDDDGSATSDGG